MSRKEGHIQNNCSGKRVNYSARTVIGGGGTLIKMGWMGIPADIDDLTYKECVQQFNIQSLSKGLKGEYPKIITVFRKNLKIDVNWVTRNYTQPFVFSGVEGLLIGDLVARQLKDGDEVILNRQPTLRKESMQGVKVKIIHGEKIFRLPLGVTRAFNADFDKRSFL